METKIIGGVAQDRDPWIDNIKGVLICLVLMGHFALLLVGHSREMVWFRQFISTFHMPGFMILTGMLAKNRIQQKRYDKMISRLFIPYIICNFVMFLIFKTLGATYVSGIPEEWFFIPLRPYYFLWFLLAVFLFSVITPVFLNNKRPLVVAMVLAILVGFMPQINYMMMTKIIPFYVYYLVGYYTDKEYLQKRLKSKKVIICSWFIVFITLVVTRMCTQFIDISFLSMESQYRDYTNISQFTSAGLRFFTILLSIIISFSVFSCIPKKENFMTIIGKYSMYPYCIHTFMMPFAFYCIRRASFTIIDNWIDYTFVFIICILAARLFVSEFIRKYTRFIIEPNICIKISIEDTEVQNK